MFITSKCQYLHIHTGLAYLYEPILITEDMVTVGLIILSMTRWLNPINFSVFVTRPALGSFSYFIPAMINCFNSFAPKGSMAALSDGGDAIWVCATVLPWQYRKALFSQRKDDAREWPYHQELVWDKIIKNKSSTTIWVFLQQNLQLNTKTVRVLEVFTILLNYVL